MMKHKWTRMGKTASSPSWRCAASATETNFIKRTTKPTLKKTSKAKGNFTKTNINTKSMKINKVLEQHQPFWHSPPV